MLQAWQALMEQYPEEKEDRQLLETMAWGIIEKGSRSSSPITVAISLVAAHKGTGRSRCLKLFCEGLKKTTMHRFGFGLRIMYTDARRRLQDQVMRMLSQERYRAVRLAAYSSSWWHEKGAAQEILEDILSDLIASRRGESGGNRGLGQSLRKCGHR